MRARMLPTLAKDAGGEYYDHDAFVEMNCEPDTLEGLIDHHNAMEDLWAIFKWGAYYYIFTKFEPAVETFKEAEAQGLCRRFPTLEAAVAYAELVG